MAWQAGDELGDRDAFLETLVRQHRTAHAVTDGPHAIDAGVAMLVDFDHAAWQAITAVRRNRRGAIQVQRGGRHGIAQLFERLPQGLRAVGGFGLGFNLAIDAASLENTHGVQKN